MAEPGANRASVVRAYYAAVDAGAIDALLALFTEDAVYRRPGYPPLDGRSAIEDFYCSERIIASGAHFLESVIAEGDEVATRGSFSGTSRGGEALSIRFADFFRFAGDRFSERNTYFDAAGV